MITGTLDCGCITRDDKPTIKCSLHLHEAKTIVEVIPEANAIITTTKPQTTALAKPELDPAIIELFTHANELKAWAESRIIARNEDLKPATEDLSVIANVKKSLVKKKKEYTTPLREQLDHVNKIFANILDPLEVADRITRNLVQTFRIEQARKVAEAEAIEADKLALAQREAEHNNGEFTVELGTTVAPPPPPKNVRTDIGTVGTRKVTRFEVVDFAAVSDEYKLIDGVKVGRVVRAGVSIPGIRVWTEDIVTVNTRKGE